MVPTLGSLLLGCAARHAPQFEYVQASAPPHGEPCVVTRIDSATGEPTARYTFDAAGLVSAWRVDPNRRQTTGKYRYDDDGRLESWRVDGLTLPLPFQPQPFRPVDTSGVVRRTEDQIDQLELSQLRAEERNTRPYDEGWTLERDRRGRVKTWRRWTGGDSPPPVRVRYRWGRVAAFVYPATGNFETATTEREVERWVYNLRGEVIRHDSGSLRSTFRHNLRGDTTSWSGQPGVRARWDRHHHLLQVEPDGPVYDYDSGGRIYTATLGTDTLWSMTYSPSCPADLSSPAFTPTFDPATTPWQRLLPDPGQP